MPVCTPRLLSTTGLSAFLTAAMELLFSTVFLMARLSDLTSTMPEEDAPLSSNSWLVPKTPACGLYLLLLLRFATSALKLPVTVVDKPSVLTSFVLPVCSGAEERSTESWNYFCSLGELELWRTARQTLRKTLPALERMLLHFRPPQGTEHKVLLTSVSEEDRNEQDTNDTFAPGAGDSSRVFDKVEVEEHAQIITDIMVPGSPDCN